MSYADTTEYSVTIYNLGIVQAVMGFVGQLLNDSLPIATKAEREFSCEISRPSLRDQTWIIPAQRLLVTMAS